MKRIQAPLSADAARSLCCGDAVLISGTLYAARDAAHKRLVAAIQNGEPLPLDLAGAVIYYVGPTPPREGRVIGSAGPTTSTRMDAYAPLLLDLGCLGMIGKGGRSRSVVDAMVRNGAVYFAATGGTGALLSRCITASETVAYEDLGAEALRRLTVVDFPATVAIDSSGNDLYQRGRQRYLASIPAQKQS